MNIILVKHLSSTHFPREKCFLVGFLFIVIFKICLPSVDPLFHLALVLQKKILQLPMALGLFCSVQPSAIGDRGRAPGMTDLYNSKRLVRLRIV
ncbi:hypothetical protein ES332_D01G152800v1 [Gossypium tomentosum]|uniref:Uncharacterized protein n=1 Tax=Gossypium tomentosum TaxID=34277 RepID=A0A5D2M9X3_GOSTO|nr:hypothetical protein ES332_D01G152800v1 [Gossypium tomentosum]